MKSKAIATKRSNATPSPAQLHGYFGSTLIGGAANFGTMAAVAYAGGGVGRYRPREEWEINRNTHTAAISDDEAEAIFRERDKQKSKHSRYRRNHYLLSCLMTCKCGARVDGEELMLVPNMATLTGTGVKAAATQRNKTLPSKQPGSPVTCT